VFRTVAQARGAFCPLVTAGQDVWSNCQGSQCMFWRWGPQAHPERISYDGWREQVLEPPRPDRVPAQYLWQGYDPSRMYFMPHWRAPDGFLDHDRRGYCGMAGKP
jgi:hypothetical protein